jgi:hypothetical protein
MPDGDFLEGVKHIHRFRKSNRIHRPIGVSVVRLNDLQNARAEPLPWLRRRRRPAELSDAERVAHVVLDCRRKCQEIALGGPYPMQRVLVGSRNTAH